MRRGTLSLIALLGLAPAGSLTLPTVTLAQQLDCRQVTASSAATCCPALLGAIPEDRMPRICNRTLGSGWEEAVVSYPAGSAEAREAIANGAITAEVVDAVTGEKSVRILGIEMGGGAPTVFKAEPGRDTRVTAGGGSPTIFKAEPGKLGVAQSSANPGGFKDPTPTTYSSDSGSSGKESTSSPSKETATPKESPPAETREEPSKEPTKK